jgi:hypothetical protein
VIEDARLRRCGHDTTNGERDSSSRVFVHSPDKQLSVIDLVLANAPALS